MPWEYDPDANWFWPAVFERKSHSKAEKAGDIENIFLGLEEAKKLHGKLLTPPFPKAKGERPMMEEYVRKARVYYKQPAVKNLSTALKGVSQMIDKALKTQLDPNSKKACQQISSTINICRDNIDPDSLEFLYSKVIESGVEQDKQFTLPQLPMLYDTFRECAKKKHPQIAEAIKELMAWPEEVEKQPKAAHSIVALLSKASRDMTQNLKNVKKAIDYGGDLGGLEDRDKITIPKLSASLTPIADEKGDLSTGKTKEDLYCLIRTVKVQADIFDQIADRLPTKREMDKNKK